jgi:Fe2+ transport system protein FeoA
MSGNGKTLASLAKGEKVVIRAVNTTDPHVPRLMTLGLVEGAEIEHATSAIGGDPIEFRLFGQCISMRREQASAFSVTPVGTLE